jgi:hypothetical protein
MIISQERFVMKYEEFLELEKSQLTKNNFGVEMLKNKSPRTLVYGIGYRLQNLVLQESQKIFMV